VAFFIARLPLQKIRHDCRSSYPPFDIQMKGNKEEKSGHFELNGFLV